MTREASELGTWLRALPSGDERQARAAEGPWFNEPHLSVRALGGPDDAVATMMPSVGGQQDRHR